MVQHITITLQELVTALKIKEDTDRRIEPIHLKQIYSKVSGLFASQIRESHAKITANFDQVPTLPYNRMYMESIFQNLIGNALKFRSPDRSPDIAVTAVLENGIPVIYFSDNGVGIDLQKHGHKLFGLHKTFHRHPDAHGVGLFLTKTQIEALSGEITVESEVDRGTVFKVTFNPEI